jgi:hypothetical protein
MQSIALPLALADEQPGVKPQFGGATRPPSVGAMLGSTTGDPVEFVIAVVEPTSAKSSAQDGALSFSEPRNKSQPRAPPAGSPRSWVPSRGSTGPIEGRWSAGGQVAQAWIGVRLG